MTLAPPSSLTAGLRSIQDFGDWLPPMLVKELRQGLRARVFVSAFVAVQAAMIVVLGLRLMGAKNNDYLPENVDGYQWLAMGVTLLILLPLRGLTVISEESKQKTIDLLVLTHMSSMRLVCGKWLALVSQTLLLVVAILPYQVLTYFFGEVDVVENLELLGWLLLASLALTALCIALSPANVLVRLVVLGLTALPVGAAGMAYLEHLDNGGGSGFLASSHPGISWICMFIFAAVSTTVFLLAVAAARVGHVAENGSTRIRCITLMMMVGGMIGICASDSRQGIAWMMLSMPVLMWAAMEAMAEHTSVLPATYLPWVKRGRPGEFLGRFLYPGWGTGVMFVLLMTAGLEIEVMLMSLRSGIGSGIGQMASSMFQFGMTMLYPGALLCVMPRLRQRHWMYILMQVGGVVWYAAGSMASFRSNAAALLGLLPTSAFLGTLGYSPGGYRDAVFGVAFMVEFVMVIWLLVRSQDEFQKIQNGETKARTLLLKTVPAASTSSPVPTLP